MPETFDDYLELNAEALDISRTMHEGATEHYRAVATFLENNGVEAHFYADGSFATGTVVRPYTEDDDAFFDLDVVGKRTDVEKSETTPDAVRGSFVGPLAESERYSGMLELCDECLTLCYADGGFRLDVVPCVADDVMLPGDPIAIACGNTTEWLSSNPQGLAEWFMGINSRFAVASAARNRQKAWVSNRDAYASINDVPDWLVRTSLQRSVQVLKRSRDVFCHHALIEDLVPSCAIMVLTASIARGLEATSGVHDVLCAVVDRLVLEVQSGLDGVEGMLGKTGSWHVDEPVSGGNLLCWDDDDARAFLRWTRGLRRSLMLSPKQDTVKFNCAMREMFGSRAKVAEVENAAPASIVTPKRPWGC